MLRPYLARSWPLRHPFQPRIRPVCAPDLRARLSLEHDYVGGEIEPALKKARADAVGIDGNVLLLELADLLDREAAGHDDLDVAIALGVERAAHVADQLRIHAGRLERAHLGNDRFVHERLGGVEPQPIPEVSQ